CCSAAAFALFGLANNLWLLFASRLVQGAGGGTTGVAQAYISDSLEPEERAKGLGWLSAATNVGVMIGPKLGSSLTQLGPQAPGLVAAALCLVNIAFTWYWLPEVRGREEKPATTGGAASAPAPRQSLRAAVRSVLRDPTAPVPSLVWVYAIGMMAFTAISSMMGLYLGARFGFNEHTIGNFFLWTGAIAVVMRAILLGPIVRRFGELAVLRIGTFAMILGFAIFPLARPCIDPHWGWDWGPCGYWSLAFVAFFVPIGTALLFPATTALVSRRSSRAETGQVLGVQQAFGGVCKVIAPLWAGWTFGHLGIRSPFWISALLMIGVSFLTHRLSDEEGRLRPAPPQPPVVVDLPGKVEPR
ncbi:MAG TPA: MFS transporter, partial [Thermoanaerobaculia bacterium]|nr:MFS transporter [Thermoanaerobaculia bacterium]